MGWAAWAAGSLLALGCEPETPVEPDASLDAAFEISGDGATSTVGDAASTASNDASAPGTTTDAGHVSDAALTDAAVGDAAALDGGTPDAGPAVPDASLPDAGDVGDAAAMDGGTPDAGPAVPDASFPDAGPGTTTGDGGATYTHSGEVVWKVLSRAGSASCPYQSIALWREETVTLRDPSASGFYCQSGCPPFSAPPDGEVVFVGGTFDLSVYLMFRPGVLSEFSTASFRANFLYAKMDWNTVPKTPLTYAQGFSPGIRTGAWQPPQPEVEIIGYEAPLLHVRLRAVGVAQWSTLRQQATLPYACVVQGKFGEFPSICSEVDCTYAADDPANGTQLTADLTLPIVPPQP
jgi:hypothetical protein